MTEGTDWTAALQGIIEQMVQSGVTELEVRQDDLRVRLKRQTGERASSTPTMLPAGTDDAVPARDGGPELHRVIAPLTGIYYVAPNASAPPYIKIGDWIEESTIVGLIETMKVFNEVTAECRGRVASLLSQQGQLVQAGDPIVLIDTEAISDSAEEVEQ